MPGGPSELAERLLASQRKFAEDVLRATAPLLPGKGQEERRRGQAGLTFAAGRTRYLR